MATASTTSPTTSELRRWRTARGLSQLLAAGFAPAFPPSPLDDAARRPVREALDPILDGHLPYPAVVGRPHGILVTANRAVAVFHEGVDPALLAPPSTCSVSLRHITTSTSTSFATAADVTLAELHLEAFLPADEATADARRAHWG